MAKHEVRLHLLCHADDVATVRAEAEKRAPGRFTFAPVGGGPDDEEPRLYIDSGQWRPAQAVAIRDACEGLPVRVVRGVALAMVEEGALVVDKGDPAPRTEATARRTLGRAIEEWDQEQGQGQEQAKEKVR